MTTKHWVVLTNNDSNKEPLIQGILKHENIVGFEPLQYLQGALFSKVALETFIDEEERHGTKAITSDTSQYLKTMSSGEQKKALLKYILKRNPAYIILDNPFDNLDASSQEELKQSLQHIANAISVVLIISRIADILPFINTYSKLDYDALKFYKSAASLNTHKLINFSAKIPSATHKLTYENNILISLNKVNVSYLDKPILKDIEWIIKKGEFWELRGKNGSGKTTILSMITGENPKGYGQDLTLFGHKKGSGESIWDIKKNIGYFTTAMTDKFTGYHTVKNMIISGLNDTIGLYNKPTEAQLRTAKEWLLVIKMWHLKDKLYHDLSMGQKRLIMCIRAMIKHPVLLILDEPTAGLDDDSALLFVALVNKFAKESRTAIIFVSHREEPGLEPNFMYELQLTTQGSIGCQN